MKKYKTDLEVLVMISKANNIRECLLSIYDNKNPSDYQYKKISFLMIESGVRFLDGSIYIHPSLKKLYKLKKNNKPLIEIKND